MTKHYVFNNPNENSYLYLSSGGIDPTKSCHHYGPGARSGYMIHCILEGKGTFTSNGVDRVLHAGDMFYCRPGQVVYTQADRNDPWTLMWVRFTGSYTESLMRTIDILFENPVFTVRQATIIKDVMDSIFEVTRIGNMSDLDYVSKLITLIDALRTVFSKTSQDIEDTKHHLITQAVQYIRNNFDTPITISSVVEYLQIDRTYLFRLFKTYLDISPKEYLINIRLRTAKEMLQKTDTPIKIIALSCGYHDYIQFSKAFRKHIGVSPSKFRNSRI